MRSVSAVFGTAPRYSKHRASAVMVASAPRLSAKQTKRILDHAITAQKTNSGPTSPQSKTNTSPGVQMPGRLPRWFLARHCAFTSATRRRKLRSEPL